MNNETRKVFVLIITAFIFICSFVPPLSPIPTVNNSTSDTSLIQLYTDSLNSTDSSAVDSRLAEAMGIDYGDEYLLALDNLIFIVIGILLVLLIVGFIILFASKTSGVFVYIRVIAILNTLTYTALIGLTIYQNNKLSGEMFGLVGRFIKISPSIGTYIGLTTSIILIFVANRERLQVDGNYNYNTNYIQTPTFMNEQQLRENIHTQTISYQNSQSMNHRNEQIVCPSCGKSCAKGTNYCAGCGNSLYLKSIFCHKCGSEVTKGASFCKSCGERLSNSSIESPKQD